MIEKMTRYDFVLLSSDKESFLADLRELGVVDIKRSDKAVDGTSEQMLEQIRLAKEEIRLVEKGTDAHLEELLTRAGEQRALAASTADEAYRRGVEMIMTQFTTTMEKLGVREIEALGKSFDPAFHNAVMHVEDEEKGENEIVEVFQKGFIMGEKVIRFAMVKVAN